MSEMQPEDVSVEDTENYEFNEETDTDIEAEDPSPEGQGSDSSPDTEDGQEEPVNFDERQQRKVDEIIGKKVFQQKELERKLKALEKSHRELLDAQSVEERPVVPDQPDPFALSDDDYRKAQNDREQALIKQAQYDARQRSLEEQQLRIMQEQQRKQHEAYVAAVESYSDRATRLGISPQELQVAGNTVAQFGLSNPVVEHILADEQGPLITKYLASNFQELEALSQMNPMQAAVRIESVIKQKAGALKPKVNRAPSPVDLPQGAGVSPQPKGPKGAIFE